MVEFLARARTHARRIRFSGDVLSRPGIPMSSVGIREWQYQDAIEISAALTPALWERLTTVCQRLFMPPQAIAAFVYSSPQVQAECATSSESQCVVRFTSALLNLLTEREFEFVLGHEVAHFLLDHAPLSIDYANPQGLLQLRSQEISADRIGLIACASLEVALRALMKTVSGLTEKHLRFDVASFIAQLTKIEGATPDWSESTHPSIIIRAKALLWLSLTEILRNGAENTSFEQLSVLDSRVQRDLRRFVDGVVSKKIEAAKRDLLLWMMTYEIMQSGTFQKAHQLKMRRLFDDQTVDKLITFVGGLAKSDLDHVIFENVRSSRTELEKLIPQTFEKELSAIQSKMDSELTR
jgi:Peptidase family M48